MNLKCFLPVLLSVTGLFACDLVKIQVFRDTQACLLLPLLRNTRSYFSFQSQSDVLQDSRRLPVPAAPAEGVSASLAWPACAALVFSPAP